MDTSGWPEHTGAGSLRFRLPPRFTLEHRTGLDQPGESYAAPGEQFLYSVGGHPSVITRDGFARVSTCQLMLENVVTITTGLDRRSRQYGVVAIWWDFAGPGAHLSIGGHTRSRAAHLEMLAAARTPRRSK